MAFQVSPGVNVSEIDLTAVVPAVSVSVGAIAGVFRWGPINERVLISNEKQLVQTFGKPATYYLDNANSPYASPWTNHETFFSAANFLGYSNALYVSRVSAGDRIEAGETTFASGTPGTITLTAGTFNNLAIGDEIVVDAELSEGVSASSNGTYKVVSKDNISSQISVEGLTDASGNTYAIEDETAVSVVITSEARVAASDSFVAKYPGRLGNSISVSYCSTDAGSASEFAAVTSTKQITVLPFASEAVVSGFVVPGEALEFADVGDDVVLPNGDRLTIETIAEEIDVNTQGATLRINLGESSTTDTVSIDASLTSVVFDATAKTLTCSAGGFEVFEVGETFNVTGSASNGSNGGPGPFTIASVTDTVITITGTFVNETVSSGTVTITGEPNSLDLANDTFTIANHGLSTGFGLVYNDGGEGNTSIEGLTDGETYYVIKVDDNTFKLATTYENALAGTADVDITAIGTNVDGVHTFAVLNTYVAQVTFDSKYTGVNTYTGTFDVQWSDSGLFLNAPRPNHVHVVVRDKFGSFTGTTNAILETYTDVSTQPGATNLDGSSNYLLDLIESNSNYIAAAGNDEAEKAQSIADLTATANSETQSLVLGYDGDDEVRAPIGDIAAGYDLYKDAADVDISLVIQGKARGTVLSNYLANNIAEYRKDCVVFVSPRVEDDTAAKVVTFASELTGSTYMVVDTGYKYQYDKYNDVYRWIPMNADVAGLCARTDNARDPWWSPAGFNRGIIKNVVKLRFNPTKAERDLLYVNSVNPVITEPGNGTLLFGDKTFSPIASAFDRINVRRLFIVLEKAISLASKSLLFEFNDEFTRAQFKNLVEPFLREVQGRRGIYDFKVVCDETNNTPEVIDSNQFVGDIFIKPARSINFIQLNFVAVRTGVEFEEIVGAV